MKKSDMQATNYIIVSHGVRSLRLNMAAGITCSVKMQRIELAFGTDKYDAMHRAAIVCAECGQNMQNRERVMGGNSGKVVKCGGICRSAKGPVCDCPCEGENHGSNH